MMKYQLTEKGFLTAEIELVPAHKARDVGFDRSYIGAYGQDDRVCAYTALAALMKVKNPARTCICLFSDKEEVGSIGILALSPSFMMRCINGADREDKWPVQPVGF